LNKKLDFIERSPDAHHQPNHTTQSTIVTLMPNQQFGFHQGRLAGLLSAKITRFI
jgi:hypothetical protein